MLKRALSILTVMSILLGTLGFQVVYHNCANCGVGRVEVTLEPENDHMHACCGTSHGCCHSDHEQSTVCSVSNCCPSELHRLNDLIFSSVSDSIKKSVVTVSKPRIDFQSAADAFAPDSWSTIISLNKIPLNGGPPAWHKTSQKHISLSVFRC